MKHEFHNEIIDRQTTGNGKVNVRERLGCFLTYYHRPVANSKVLSRFRIAIHGEIALLQEVLRIKDERRF